jgi:hypothetical protein
MRHVLGCALVVALTFAASTASASMCPVLVKQGRDAAATMNQNDAKVKNALAKLDRAAALHKEGKHADSMREANEALGLLGAKK